MIANSVSGGGAKNNTTPRNPIPAPTTPNPTPSPTFLYPVAGAQVTQAFGHRPTNPSIRYQSGTNLGTDFAAPAGSAINSPVSGRVVGINPGAGAWGNQVVIDAGHGRQIAFNHMSGFGKITKGQRINAGYTLGRVGQTGQTTGPHLDMETTINGTSVPIDTAFQGYQFDDAYKGVNLTEKGAQGYNRSQNRFYNLNDLSRSTGSVYSYGSGGGATPSVNNATYTRTSTNSLPSSDNSDVMTQGKLNSLMSGMDSGLTTGVTSTKRVGALGIDVSA